jgi:hypothetical protein
MAIKKKYQEGGSRGITPQMLLRQAWKESSFRPKVTNRLGYKGLAQVGDAVINDYKKAHNLKEFDPHEPESARKIQEWYMNNLYNASFVNKPNQSEQVRQAKAFAAYNWGRGNLVKHLMKAKHSGQDIYKSMDWLESAPKETSDYVKKILGLDKAFNKEFDSVRQLPKYKPIVEHYKQEGGSKNNTDMDNDLLTYLKGPTHEQHPQGGIPVGKDLLEGNEAMDKNYVWSARFGPSETELKKAGLPIKGVWKKNLSWADYMDRLAKVRTDQGAKTDMSVQQQWNEEKERAKAAAEQKRIERGGPSTQEYNQNPDPSTLLNAQMQLGGWLSGDPSNILNLSNSLKRSGAGLGGMNLARGLGVGTTALELGMQAFGKPKVQGPQAVGMQVDKGMAAGSSALKGALAGTALGPIGALGGAVIGGVTGLIGANKQKKEIEEANRVNMFKMNNAYLDENTMNMAYGGKKKYQEGGNRIPDKIVFPKDTSSLKEQAFHLKYKRDMLAKEGLDLFKTTGLKDANSAWNRVGEMDATLREMLESLEFARNNRYRELIPEHLKTGDTVPMQGPKKMQWGGFAREQEEPIRRTPPSPVIPTGPMQGPQYPTVPEHLRTNQELSPYLTGNFIGPPLSYNQSSSTPFAEPSNLAQSRTTAGTSGTKREPLSKVDPKWNLLNDPVLGGYNLPEDIKAAEFTGNSNMRQFSDKEIKQAERKDWWNENKSAIGNTANTAMRFAPAATNLLQYLNMNKPSYERLSRINSKFKPNYIDQESVLNPIKEQESATRRALTEASGGDVGALRSNLLAAHLNSMKGRTAGLLGAKQFNIGQDNMAQQFDQRNQQFNAQQGNLEMDINQRNKAAYDMNRSRFLSQIGQDIGNIGLENQRKKYPEMMGLYYDWLGKFMEENQGKEKSKAK